jgi:hypothetical protein
MDTESGYYFRDIYDSLINRLNDFPSDDSSPNLQKCLKEPNFVRAEMLARQHNLPSETIIQIQEMTVLQYLIDYKNIPGLAKVMDLYKMTPMELDRIVEIIKKEKYYPCHSTSRTTETGIKWTDVETQEIKDTKAWYNQFYK